MTIVTPEYMAVRLSKKHKLTLNGTVPVISIQILDSEGGVCGKIGYISPRDSSLIIDGVSIPNAVISAAKMLGEDELVYLDAKGQVVVPF